MNERRVAILKLGQDLIAAIQDDLTDTEWTRFRDELVQHAGRYRSSGVVVDVSAMELIDSYCSRVLDGLARVLQLRGARTVIVGVNPGVASTMAQLGLRLDSAGIALDLEGGLELLALERTHGG